MYALTIPEMRVLYAGYIRKQELQDDKAKGISQGDRQGLKEFDSKLKGN